jgi:hypothetical protein
MANLPPGRSRDGLQRLIDGTWHGVGRCGFWKKVVGLVTNI